MDGLLDLQMNTALTGGSAADRAPRMPVAGSEDEARAAAQDFESFFISQMMDQMFAQVGEDNPFGGGPGENAFRGMLNEEYARVIAQGGGLGLSDRLTSEILRYQEAAGGSDE